MAGRRNATREASPRDMWVDLRILRARAPGPLHRTTVLRYAPVMLTQWSEDIVMVDLANDPQVGEDLKAAIEHIASEETQTVPHVVLNMGLVSYITSSNISQLLRLRKLVADVGRTLRLCSVDERVFSVLKVAGLDKVFEFSPDPMTALASIQIETGAEDGEPTGADSQTG